MYSGFNDAFKKYFEGEDPVKITNQLAKEGKIVIRPVKGGECSIFLKMRLLQGQREKMR